MFHLKPIGIGTPYVESLTGYIKRLAEAHSVSVGILLSKEILPTIENNTNKRIWNANIYGKRSRRINSVSCLSHNIIDVLSQKTLIEGLKSLTFLWTDVIDNKYIFRDHQVWCPLCYQENLETKQSIYEPLLWNFKEVKTCKRHNTFLVDECPCCHNRLEILSNLSRPGYCNKCHAWLGQNNNENNQIQENNLDWHNWVFDNIGNLIASPTVNFNSTYFVLNLQNYLVKESISMRKLAESIGVTHHTIRRWLDGRSLDLLDVLTLSYVINYPLIDILNKEIIYPDAAPARKTLLVNKKRNKEPNDYENIKLIITDVLESNKELSLRELSRQTGISDKSLRKYLPEEVIKLKSHNQETLKISKDKKIDLIKETIMTLHQRGDRPSQKALSRELGKRVIINNEEREVYLKTLEEIGCISEEYS